MSKLGIFLTKQELRSVYDNFDLNKDGTIQYEEFIQALRVSFKTKILAKNKKQPF